MSGKIAAALIAHNAEGKINDVLQSLKGQVDYIVVAIDPKTTDGTRAVCERHGAIVVDGLDAWEVGFSAARDVSFAAVPSDVEWTLWIDTDDVLKCDVPLRRLVEAAPPDAVGIALPYAYFRDSFGNLTTVFDRERVMRMAAKPKWRGWLHEICEATLPGKMIRTYEKPEQSPIWIEHKNRADDGKGDRNFHLLRKWLEAEPQSSRCMWYFGMQHFAANQWQDAAAWFEKAVEHHPGNHLEPWQALVYAAKAYRSLGQNDRSIGAANRAMMMFPDLADPYHEMSASYQAAGDWLKAIWWHEQALNKNQPGGPVMMNPLDYSFNPFVTIHTAYAMLGRFDEALAKIDRALSVRPDPLVQKVRAAYAHKINRLKAIDGGLMLAEHLANTAELDKAKTVMRSMPVGAAEEDGRILQAAGYVHRATGHLRREDSYEDFYFQIKEEDTKPNERHEWIVNHAVSTDAKRVLWIGAGNLAGPLLLAERGVKVVVVECDPRRVRMGNHEAAKRKLLKRYHDKDAGMMLPLMMRKGKHDPGLPIQFWYGYGERLPEAAKNLAPYDLVVCGSLLARVPDPVALVNSVAGIGSRVLHTVHDGRALASPEPPEGTVRMFSRLDLEQMFASGNRVLESRNFGPEQRLLAFEYVPGENWGNEEHPSVVIYCGPGWEEWNPDQIDQKGLGGSETAVVLLGRELVRKGMRVTVYGPSDGVWDGVVYRHWQKFDPAAGCYLFVSWRNPRMFDNDIRAVRKALWVHDTDYREMVTEERMAKVDSIWVMSEWHRQHWSDLYPYTSGKVLVVGNGLRADRFSPIDVPRDQTKIVYSSSPDRGLSQLLDYWPEITKAIPHVTLDIYYDWTNYDLMGGPTDFKEMIMGKVRQIGVNWCGRVGQQALADSLKKAGALLYPGPHDFCETFGITFLEAQAAGCVPVTRDNGALPETNRYGIIVPNDSPVDEWVSAVQAALARSETDRAEMSTWAKTQTWEAVANRIVQWAIAEEKANGTE